MKKIILLISLFAAVNINAQFDSLIFYIDGLYLDYNRRDVYALSDQNNDGYDEIMIYDCNRKELLVFFGGSPMDTTPDIIIPLGILPSVTAIDLNDDGKEDITITDYFPIRKIKIYWGGSQLDSIPDLVFSPPSEHSGTLFNIKDFNGDGRDELVVYGTFPDSNNKQYGRYYFYNTEDQFDTIPHYVISGDSINKIRLSPFGFSSGDLNGDGKTDLTIYGRIGEQPPYSFFRNFYMGNESWDLIEDQVFYQDEHSFVLDEMRIIEDINGDNKDDILIKAYGNVYPFYWDNSILYGSFPVDTLQDVGLNTQNEALAEGTEARVGDVNGDGFNDIFIQTLAGYPDVKLWLGSSTMYELPAKEWEGTSAGFGRVIAGVGDVNGDDVNDIAISEIHFGTPTPNCNLGKIYIFMGDTSVVTTVDEEGLIKPGSFELYQNHPNPFNSSTIITYTIAERSFVNLTVYDILGGEVTTLVRENKPSGKYSVEFNASNLPSGIYFYRIVSGNFTATKKLIFLK